jgi:type 1 glutamine amidotransferase
LVAFGDAEVRRDEVFWPELSHLLQASNWILSVSRQPFKLDTAWVGPRLAIETKTRIMLKKLTSLLVILAAAFSLQAEPAKIKVLLLSGDDVSAHKWQEMATATKQVLVDSGKFEVTVAEQLTALESETLAKDYDVIFMTRYNTKAVLSDKAKANLVNFVKSGKGFVLSHLASASFADWPEFRKMVGRYWVMGSSGHGPRTPFKSVIADKTSPITQGISDFQVDDELYAKLQGDEPIHILVTADSDFSKKTEPMAFTLNYGKGRVFSETFGHDGKAIKTPEVSKLIVQGVEWAADKK